MPRNSSGGSSSSKRKMDMGEGFSFFGKRSKASPAPPPATTGRGRGGRSSSGGHCTADSEACLFNQKKCVAWFKEYAVAGQPDTIGPEGVESLCQDLVVDPENIAMLVLAWKMGAKQMGYFTLQEWLHGLTELQCDSLVKLRDKLDYLHSLLQDSASFKSIYRYAFDFARDKDQRSLDIETAKAMLALLLARQWALLPVFFQFLEQSRYRVLNKDQWCNVLEFSRAVDPDLTNYDVDGAWPVMLDEFVEWLKTNRNQDCPPLQ